MKNTLVVALACFLLPFTVRAAVPGTFDFEDDESCLMCHKYPMMGLQSKDGTVRSFYIVPGLFSQTVHRNVPCRDCHSYIKKLPHDPVEVGVTCDSVCHSIKNPATGKRFSHKPIYDFYRQSVHGREKSAEGPDSDKPYCINCHTNPLYNPAEPMPPERITKRCIVCHEDADFVRRWYSHTSRRIREVKRSPSEIVELCGSCHGDEDLVARRVELAQNEGRELGRKFGYALESYRESFHGRLTGYGFNKTASCLDCHADNDNYFKNVHNILPSRDPDSTVNIDNKVKTCSRCHIYADDSFAQLDPHPGEGLHENPVRYYAELSYNAMSWMVIIGLVGISVFETVGRWRDGVAFRLHLGTSWRRRGSRGRDRVV